ncbi:MAG: hypothetical protein WA896_13315, partial [Spirulinaceae cyanobacterium]
MFRGGTGQYRHNATGFSFDTQSFIYGINPDIFDASDTSNLDNNGRSQKGHFVYRIGQNGVATPISGAISAGASTDAQGTRYIAGDIGINGNYYVYGQSGANGVLL